MANVTFNQWRDSINVVRIYKGIPTIHIFRVIGVAKNMFVGWQLKFNSNLFLEVQRTWSTMDATHVSAFVEHIHNAGAILFTGQCQDGLTKPLFAISSKALVIFVLFINLAAGNNNLMSGVPS